MNKIFKFIVLFLVFTIFSFSIGCNDSTPYIGENGNWWVNDKDTGVSAQGEQGEIGVSITNIEKTSSNDNVDIYTITYSDGQQSAFSVKNGDNLTIKSVVKVKSEGLVDTYKITFSDASTTTFTITNGNDGTVVTILKIEKTKTEGLIDTYTITYTDGKSLTFTVANGAKGADGRDGQDGSDGKDGLTPYIGENGNWWIGDSDTGYFAGYLQNDTELTPESSGLIFTNAVVNGKAGLVVTDWDGDMLDEDLADDIESGKRNCDIEIPDYVGATPVIGIAEGVFNGKSFITSIKLSKNTVYLGESTFKNCTKLSKVDFNGCKLTAIPNYCFYGTNIKEIKLPETVTKLGDYSFGNLYLQDFDYSNITYFGQYCLQYLFTPYVYLDREVEYVGSNAFASTFVYIEAETIPTTWGSNISGNTTTITGCVDSKEYIYSKYSDGISLHAYKGDLKWLEIPKTIDGFTVRQIGYGFDSIHYNYADYMEDYYEVLYSGNDDEFCYKFKNMEGIIIPNTVTTIEYYSLMNFGAFIYIPESVNTMWQYAGWFLADDDCQMSLLAFESTSMPTFKEKWIETSNSCTYNNYLTYVATGIDYSKVLYDEAKEMVFYKESNGCSLLACLDYDSKNITIPSTYEEYKVYTIRKAALKCNYYVNSITIENGINKIQGYAFLCLEELNFVYIPSSVSIINAYGFSNSGSKFYVAANEKPSEWDSYWAGSSTSSYKVTYGVSSEIKYYDNFVYCVNSNNTIKLLSYVGNYKSNNTIKIPRTIDGKTVTTIAEGFYYTTNSYSGVCIYIPSTVTTIEKYAFNYRCSSYYSSSYYPNFYLEVETIPSTWDSYWSYENYSGYTNRCYIYYKQTFNY